MSVILVVFVLKAIMRIAKAEKMVEVLREEIGMIESHLSPALLSLTIL